MVSSGWLKYYLYKLKKNLKWSKTSYYRMKKRIFIFLLSSFILCVSCSQKTEKVRVVPINDLQIVIDSLTNLYAKENTTCELIMDKNHPFCISMIFHIGTSSILKEDVLSACYFLSNEHEVIIYSGVEPYFNLPGKEVNFGNFEELKSSNEHLLWSIKMCDESKWTINPGIGIVINVHSVDSVEPFPSRLAVE